MSASSATLKRPRAAPPRPAKGTPPAERRHHAAPVRALDAAPHGTAATLPGGASIAITGWTRDTALWVDFSVLIDAWRADRA